METAAITLTRTLAIADEHREAGRADAAALLYGQVLGVMPDNVDALDGLAAVHRSAGRDREAESLLTAAVAVDPRNTDLHAALLDVRAALGPLAALDPPRSFARRVANRLVLPAVEAAATRPRIWKYRALSSCTRLSGRPVTLQPVMFLGPGAIVLGEGVQFGWKRSPFFYTGYCHVEAGTLDARVEVGDRTEFNNNLMIKSEGPGVTVGRDGLFGPNVEIFDTDFHAVAPGERHHGEARRTAVRIGDNVFVGMSVKILKGVVIGADAVIGAGSVVTSSIPGGVIAAGNPARVIRDL